MQAIHVTSMQYHIACSREKDVRSKHRNIVSSAAVRCPWSVVDGEKACELIMITPGPNAYLSQKSEYPPLATIENKTPFLCPQTLDLYEGRVVMANRRKTIIP